MPFVEQIRKVLPWSYPAEVGHSMLRSMVSVMYPLADFTNRLPMFRYHGGISKDRKSAFSSIL